MAEQNSESLTSESLQSYEDMQATHAEQAAQVEHSVQQYMAAVDRNRTRDLVVPEGGYEKAHYVYRDQPRERGRNMTRTEYLDRVQERRAQSHRFAPCVLNRRSSSSPSYPDQKGGDLERK